MMEYKVYATLEIKAVGNGASEQEVLDRALKKKNYDIISSKINAQPVENYVSLTEYAKIHNMVDNSYVRKLCIAGKIPGAIKIGNAWAIPENTQIIDRRRTADGKWEEWYRKHGRKQYERRKAAAQEAKGQESTATAPEKPL